MGHGLLGVFRFSRQAGHQDSHADDLEWRPIGRAKRRRTTLLGILQIHQSSELIEEKCGNVGAFISMTYRQVWRGWPGQPDLREGCFCRGSQQAWERILPWHRGPCRPTRYRAGFGNVPDIPIRRGESDGGRRQRWREPVRFPGWYGRRVMEPCLSSTYVFPMEVR